MTSIHLRGILCASLVCRAKDDAEIGVSPRFRSARGATSRGYAAAGSRCEAGRSGQTPRGLEANGVDVGEGQSIRLTCSIGFSSWPFFKHEPDSLGWQEVLDLADRSLYLVKNSGRNAWMGVAARSDYRGQADYSVLNDFRTAESIGVISIHSSANAGFRVPHALAVRQSSPHDARAAS